MTVTCRYTTVEEVGVCVGDCSGDLCVGVGVCLGLSLTVSYRGETRVSKKGWRANYTAPSRASCTSPTRNCEGNGRQERSALSMCERTRENPAMR